MFSNIGSNSINNGVCQVNIWIANHTWATAYICNRINKNVLIYYRRWFNLPAFCKTSCRMLSHLSYQDQAFLALVVYIFQKVESHLISNISPLINGCNNSLKQLSRIIAISLGYSIYSNPQRPSDPYMPIYAYIMPSFAQIKTWCGARNWALSETIMT